MIPAFAVSAHLTSRKPRHRIYIIILIRVYKHAIQAKSPFEGKAEGKA